MATNTSRLGLLKKDTATDGNDTFNIKTMLNDNWDKIDAKVATLGADGKVPADQLSISVNDASTTQKGVVQLEDSVTSTSITKAATPNSVKQVNDALTSHQTDDAKEHQRLETLNANLQKEVAYLKLKQTASDRIQNGTTFADDMNGNRFGMTFNQAESSNIVIRDGAMMMLQGTQVTNTVTDKAVIASAYDTSGNGGRKLVRLSNGTLFAAVKNSSNFYIYKSTDNGNNWSSVLSATGSNPIDIALVTNGISVFAIASLSDGKVSSYGLLNGTTITSTVNIDTAQIATGNVSLAINDAGTELHAAWASKNATYPNSFNIRYAKGTINGDGTVTWGTVVQVTADSTSNLNNTNPSIVINANGYPVIIWAYEYPSGTCKINSIRWNGTSWGTFSTIYSISSYPQNSPSAIFVPQSINGLANGRIWVAWHGTDSTDTSANNIRVSYSDDVGVTWSAMQKLTSGNTASHSSTSLSANKNNEIFLTYRNGSSGNIVYKKYTTSWSSDITVRTGNNYAVSTICDVSLNFSLPLLVYNDSTKVGFYGTWTVGSESPTLTATAVYDLPSTDYVGAFVQKVGNVNMDAYINNVLMTESLETDEYMFTQSLATPATVKLRLELSRASTSGGNNDKVTRILGGIA